MKNIQGKTILIVEDSPADAKLLEIHLREYGYETIKVWSGEECIEKVREIQVDLIMLDVLMPGMDGFWVTRLLREDISTRLIPIIMITSLSDREDRIKGIDAGADDFISKPFDKDEVMARVRTTLKLSYYRRNLYESERFERIIEEISDGVVLCYPDWTIEKTNKAARSFLGLPERPSCNLLDYLKLNFETSISRDMIADTSIRRKSFNITAKGGSGKGVFSLQTNLDIFLFPTGEVSGFLLVMRQQQQPGFSDNTVSEEYHGRRS